MYSMRETAELPIDWTFAENRPDANIKIGMK